MANETPNKLIVLEEEYARDEKPQQQQADVITLCKTNKGGGLKVVHDGTWYYTSWHQFKKMMSGRAGGCVFQRIAQPKEVTQ